VGLADSYLVLKSLSLITSQEARTSVEAPLRRALEIDDRLGEAHTSLAWVRFAYDWDWPAAEREFRRATELQPNHATTHQWYAEYLAAMGRFDESRAEIGRALELEPASPIINVIAAQIQFYARQYDRVIEQCRRTLELAPDFYIAHDYLGWAYRQKGMYDTPLQLCEIGHSYAAAGNQREARKALREVIEGSRRKHSPRHSYRLARIHAALGERDAAFEWLEVAFEEREENLVWLSVDPHLDPLRADPRFAVLVRRMGFAPR
jgi:Tfp pilus assembly protein PilF